MPLTPPPLYNLKNRCRFKTAASSFNYPAGYLENVRALGPYFDEIELLFLESRHATSLPDKALIKDLARFKDEFQITYNIHLPADIAPNAADKTKAARDTDTLRRFIAATLPLEPTSFCLHLPGDDAPDFAGRCHRALNGILATGLPPPLLTVENLDYPLTAIKDALDATGVSVCFDMGHALAFNTGFAEHIKAFGERITVAHLHSPGPAGDDHKELACLGANWPKVWDFLRGFNGTVVLEVFSIETLNKSLAFWQPFLEELE